MVARAFKQIKDTSVLPNLVAALNDKEKEEMVRNEYVKALSTISGQNCR
jgi:hypothetical protein